MGAVLEMKPFVYTIAAALILAGCAAREEGEGPGLGERFVAVTQFAGRITGGIGSDNAVRGDRTVPGGFAPEAIAAEPGAYRLIQVNALGLAEPARIIQENGDETTLALQSGPTAAFDGGILVATRGFGEDLLTIDSRGVLDALRAGGGSVARRMEVLDDQDQILTSDFACTVAAAGTETINLGLREATLRRFDENCRSEAIIFDNIYWLDREGRILASRQFVSPAIAYLRSNAL